MLRNVKSSLCSDEIAAAVGGFDFICEADFIRGYTDFIVSEENDFIEIKCLLWFAFCGVRPKIDILRKKDVDFYFFTINYSLFTEFAFGFLEGKK